MAGKVTYTFLDYDNEPSTVTIPIDLSSALWDAGQDELDNLRAAINGVTLCVHAKEERTQSVTILAGAGPDDKTCQREVKWLVRMTEDDTFRKLSFTIPGADYSLLNLANKGRMIIASGAGQTLVTQIEGAYVTDRGKGVTVDEIVLVGRNS